MTTTPPPDLRWAPTPTPESFRYEERERVGVITLARPERFNALTFQVYRELTDLFKTVGGRTYDPSGEGARALVLQGEGRAFCGGGDVDDIITRLFERDTEGLLRFTRMTGELIQAMRMCPLPIVCSIKRVAAGAGAVMALASDLRVIGRGGFFSFLFPQVGLSGADMGASLPPPAGRRPRPRQRDPDARRPGDGRALRPDRPGQPRGRRRARPRERRPRGLQARRRARRRPPLLAADDQADAPAGARHGPRRGDRGRGPGPGDLHAAPRLPRGRPGPRRQAQAALEVGPR
ncbi:MAG: enoyl-CoA hydratase/isomerase family protein [Myxococcales bacterium]|nr:enoyl-CoA hydratase/isomerase family protein [Myxococcales bacterium]